MQFATPILIIFLQSYVSYSVEERTIVCIYSEFVEPPHISFAHAARTYVRTQSIASLKSELKKYNEQHPALQEALENAKQSFRTKALRYYEAHEIEEKIQKAQESSSELPLLNNIFLAHRAVVENSEAIRKADQQLAQNHQEMRKQEKNIASLKAERKRELDKVHLVIQANALIQHTHTLLTTAFGYTFRNCVQIANKATELKVVQNELTSLAYRSQFLTQQNIDELKRTCDKTSDTSHEMESLAKQVHNCARAQRQK